MLVSLPELQTIVLAAVLIIASGFLTKVGEAAWESLQEKIRRRRRQE